MRSPSTRRRNPGFTMLELILAMALMVMLVGLIFGTSSTSLALGNTIVKTQNEEMLHQAFFEFLGRRLGSLPGNARFDLKVAENSTPYLSDITLQNVPQGFSWGGKSSTAMAIQISTVKRRNDYLDIVLKYYEEEILENPGSPVPVSAEAKKPIAEIVLLSGVRYFEWRVLDGRTMNWQYDWDQVGRLPLQLELIMSIGLKGEEIRQVFWVVPKINPQNRIAQNQAAEEPQDGSGDPGSGAPDPDSSQPPTLTPPPNN